MGLIDFLKNLLGIDSTPEYMRRPGRMPSSVEGRDYVSRPHETPASTAQASARPRANSQLNGLDVDKFAPLTTKEALGETGAADWKSAYYDSTWVIPPEDLPRIRVIDGTMVGLGLISSEELARIHEIGREMGPYQNQNQWGIVEQAATDAVTRSREQRQRIKDEKKRAAEERRQKHVAAVAHRRATDIVFLGRGVSKGLSDRRANVEKLAANHLPILAAPADLATAMGIAIPKLRWLAFHSEAPTRTHYVYFKIPKKGGGERRLAAPHKQLAAAQRWIFENVLNKLPVHDAAHGFVRERSTVTNADVHVGADVVINADLCDFFPTITFFRVAGLFRSFGYSPAVATILALICTECPRDAVTFAGETYYPATGQRGLPQGACTSPAISNLICRNLDLRFAAIANRMQWRYTRYADDLTLSTSKEHDDKIGYMLARIRHIAEDEGFRINAKKTRVQRNHMRQSVTGIVVNDKRNIDRKTIRRLRAILHNAKRTGFAAQNTENRPHFESWLRGMIAYVSMVNPERGHELREQFEALR